MQRIKIAALGWTEDALTLGAMRALKMRQPRAAAARARLAAADWLRAEGVAFETLDALYEDCEDFDELNRKIADAVKAAEGAVYGVPDLRDETVRLLLRECEAECLPGVPAESALLALAQGPVVSLAAADWESFLPSAHVGCLVRELDSGNCQRSQASVDGGIPSERFRGVCRARTAGRRPLNLRNWIVCGNMGRALARMFPVWRIFRDWNATISRIWPKLCAACARRMAAVGSRTNARIDAGQSAGRGL